MTAFGAGSALLMSAYLVLARKYRPATFRDVIGQSHVVKTLANSIVSGRIAHAFLFCGVRGVGKTTVARVLAKALNCTGRPSDDANPCNACPSCNEINLGNSVDVQEIDGASHTSVENIREINENIRYSPAGSKYKIIIIDEVHMISINAFNALLKTLEEPPSHAKFIFATTESHKVPATINSRCQRFNFRTVSLNDIVNGMAAILEKEGITADHDALVMIATEAQGSFRDALSLLDQVIAVSAGHISTEVVTTCFGIAGREIFGQLISAIIGRDAALSLELLHRIFEQGYDAEQFNLDLIQYVRNLSVVKAVPAASRPEGMVDAAPSELEEMQAIADRAGLEELQNIFAVLLRSESDVKRAKNPWLALEMLTIRLANAPKLVDLAKLIGRIDAGESIRPRPAPPKPPVRVTEKPRPAPFKAPPPEAPVIEKPAPDPCQKPSGGRPEDLWTQLRRDFAAAGDLILPQIMEHGGIIEMSENEIEIGFNKDIYRQQFESKLKGEANIKQIVENILGNSRLKIFTLAQETHLKVETPFSQPNGEVTDRVRALRGEALENPVIKAILSEFEGSSIEDIVVLDK
jgi:DNA polymerase III subunit gamma/tau